LPDRFALGPHGGPEQNNLNPTTFQHADKERKCEKLWTLPDSLGHLAGDKLLQSIAKRLQSCVRRTDTVCRHGGDEFVVLLSEVQRTDDAARLAGQILESVAEPHSLDGHSLNVTGSVGISLYPDHGLDAASLLENADSAMYQVKENGRQGYKFFASAVKTP
jgi:diguanylate cyclase (GGDEF)-like protein